MLDTHTSRLELEYQEPEVLTRAKRQEPVSEINITPLIDICLVIIVALMIISPFLSRPKAKMMLPVSELTAEEDEDKVVISYSNVPPDDAGEDWYPIIAVDNKEYSDFESFIEALKPKYTYETGAQMDILTVIQCDARMHYRDVQAVIDIAQSAGGQRFAFATEEIVTDVPTEGVSQPPSGGSGPAVGGVPG
jgi:biopolymer transport protein ExbD